MARLSITLIALLPILCYHKIGPESEEGRYLNVSPEVFESHVRFFCRKGRKFARGGDLESGIPQGCVCLTFDDAYRSAIANGVEILARNGVWGTFYAVPGRVGTTSSWDVGKERPLAGWDELLAAQSEGMEIGNHTFSHADLSKLSLESQIHEIQSAEDLLLQHGLDARSLCFPYGRFNADTALAMEQEKITVGMALGRRSARSGDDLGCLPRIVLSFSDRLPKLLYKIHVRPVLPRFKRRAHYVGG